MEIKTDEDYEKALERIDELLVSMDDDKREEYDILTAAVEHYESIIYPEDFEPSVEDAISRRMMDYLL